MKDPNNIRNRWHRYREACIAYGWSFSHFRDHARYLWCNPKSYTAKASDCPLARWDAIQSDTVFSGTVVRYMHDTDYVIVGRYFT